MKIKKVNWSGLCSAMVWCFNHHWIIQTLLAGLFRELRVKVLSPTMNTIFTKPFSGRTFQSHVLRLIIHGQRTTMGLRGLCILYGGCLLKVCHFYFCFSEKTFLSLRKWMVSKGGGHVLEQHLGFADGCILWLLDSPPPPPPLYFSCLKILCENTRGYNIKLCKTSQDRRNGEDVTLEDNICVIHALF